MQNSNPRILEKHNLREDVLTLALVQMHGLHHLTSNFINGTLHHHH
jgi:hypothetical protein